MKNWWRALEYFRPEWPRVLLALAAMALGIGANLLKPWPVALVIDHIIGGKPAPAWLPDRLAVFAPAALLPIAALMIFVLHAAQGGFSAWQNFLSIRASLAGLSRLRVELFERMQRLSLAFYQRRNQGDLIYRAAWDTYSLQTLFQQGFFRFLNSFATVLLMLVVLWRVNHSLSLFTVAVFPPLIATMLFFGKRMSRRGLEAHQADSAVTSLVQQNIASLPLIQSYVRESEESAAFSRQVQISFARRVAQHRVELVYWLVITVLFGAATAGLAWRGGAEILRGRLTVGELVIFLSYLGQLYEPLNQLSHAGATVSDAKAGVQRIFEILDAGEDVRAPAAPRKFPEGAGIRFADVSFGYDPVKPVLKHVSLEIAPGEKIGLIGPSGAGKTTLLNLLPRFYDPAAGFIEIGGTDLREIALDDLRRHVACVFQESVLLPGTIAENIAFARPGASRAEIEEAARLANAHGFIEKLPRGYDTLAGEGAARLSVGEKQRLSIARAFLKNAPILVLDEPTSALDAETEASVIESLTRLMQNRTAIMAAHRLWTLQHADRLVVLEHGVISETGTPAELRGRGGYLDRMERF